jgi:hypothetical protein
VAQFGLDVVTPSALGEIINGNTVTASRWLGCNPASVPAEEGDISVRLPDIDDDLVSISVQLSLATR